jgi:SET domain-containing protein
MSVIFAGKQKACFKAIKTNQFLHRNRKSQTIDEIMVCHCKPSPDGRLGCGEECLNRMLNIECLQGTCPAGDLCSNQQFQKRKYVKFERFQSGKKGYGLRLLEDVREGQFLIEYVGEVCLK